MPQMSPMNWMILSTMFLSLILMLKAIINTSQKSSQQKTTIKNSLHNNMKW